jgi:adenylate kinase family enzyme
MVVLAMENEERLETWKDFTKFMEYTVWGYFVAEMVLKSISSGFILKSGPSAPYLGHQRGRNDFAFVVVAALTQVPSVNTYLYDEYEIENRHLRILRGLGPMVGLLQSHGIRGVMHSFYSCLPGVATVMVPMIFVLIMFALLGFELYNGLLRRCECPPPNVNATTGGDRVEGMDWCNNEGAAVSCSTNVTYFEGDDCFGYGSEWSDLIPIENRTGCDLRGYQWSNDVQTGSFDDVITAAITLFKASTTGATDLLYVAMDAASVKDELPSRNNTPGAAVFLTVFHTVFTMFLLNIFIGVMSSTFSIQTGKAIETDGEKRWNQLLKDVGRFKPTHSAEEQFRPDDPDSRWYEYQMKAFEVATHYAFSTMCVFMVLGNTILLITEHYPASTEYIYYTELLNLGFITWFAIEFIVKLAGFGLRNYFSDGWLIFDFIIISSTWAIKVSSSNAAGMDLFKVARCMKIFLLAKRLHSLVELMHVVGACITQAANVAVIMLVITYIYAIMGMKVYGAATLLPQTNFRDFQHAMKLLIQVMTGQSYGKIISLLMAEGADTGGPYSEYGGLAFFVTYYILSVFICANLFIVTVLDNFDVASRSGQVIKPDEFWGFTYAWGELTVGAHAVPVLEGSQVMDFVKKLRKVVDKAKEELDVPTVSIKVKNIPNDHARPEIISEKFSKYGEIENIEIRPHYPLSGAFVTYHDKTKFDEDRCFKDEIIIGLLDGEPCRVEVGFTRHGDFPHGIIAISLPDRKRLDRGTMQIDITRGDGIKNGIQPYVQVTSVAKHTHHGGKNVSKITRSINRNSMVEDALGLPSMIVIAPPGAQKFQYCKQIAKRYGLVHIDVGEMLREEEADKILSAEQERKEQAEQEGTHGRKSPGSLLNHETVRENWFISQEEENAERDAEQAARERAAGDTTPDSTGALTPGRIRKGMSRNEKRKSMGVSTSTAPEDHLKGLRSHVEHHPALHSGKLVGDKHVLPLVRARIEAAEENDQGFILSGFPRTKRQAHQLKAMGAIPGAVVVLDVESDECHRGCRERKIDPKTGRVYDMLLNPPKRSEVQARVVSRRDDHDPKVIETRLKRYADHADETIDALDKITAKDAVFRLQVHDPRETLADMMGLMEVTFGDATHYNADATPSAPVPAEWDGDDPLCFHVNEHTRRYEFKVFDAAAFNLEPLGSFSIDLQPMIEMAHFIEDREVDWSDDNLDDLLTLKSLNPINALATMNKTLKEAEKLTKLAVQEAEKAKNFAIESAAMAAEMALETVGVESTLMQGLAEDGAKTHALEFKNDKDEVTCTLMCQLRFHTREWVPDWNFISEFGDDNKFLKPHSSGIEGWVERKEGFKSGKWEGKWMFITEHPPQLCILDVANEQELRSVMKGKQGKVPEETITRILPHEIHQLRNGFTRRRQKSKKSKAKFAKDEDCQFEFTTLDEIDHSKVGLHDGTKSPGRRNGVLHVQVVEAKGLPHMDVKGDTDGYVVLELEGVQHKTAVVEDTIDPSWDESCSFSVFDKASPLMISIFDEDPHSNDDIIGKITLDVSELLEDQPKEVWSEIKKVTGGPAKIMFSGGKSGPGALGQLKLVLNWADAENSEVLLQRWTEDDILNNRLRVQSAQWRFRVASPEVKYSWLQAIAWVERGCDGPRPPMIAVPSICDEDMKRVENDPSTVDLPIAKCRHLLYNLRQFDCLGLKEGRDATLYATFQLELHAWKKVYQKDRRKKITGAGASVDSFHGLDFKLTLQRLCLLRYGKAQSLSYHQMMDEYEHEKAHIALHMIQTCLLAWIYRRRGTYTGTDKRRAVHAMWKKGHMPEGEVAQCYFSAIRGVRNIRFEALSHLRRLVNKQNPDIHHGSWDPSKVKQTREEKKRAKKEASAEAKRLAKEQREQEFNEKHDRDQQAQLALANDALQVRRSGRHGGNQTFENPVLYSGSEEEDDDGVGDNGVMSGHLAPRTELQMRKMSSSSFEDESVVPASFEDETTPRSLFDNGDSGSGRASPTREKGNIWSSDEDD